MSRYLCQSGRTDMFGLVDDQVKQTNVIDHFAESERDRTRHTLIPALLQTGSSSLRPAAGVFELASIFRCIAITS